MCGAGSRGARVSDAPVSGPFLALVVWPSWRGARAARSVVRAWKTVRRWVESVVGVISIKNRRQKPVAAPSGCCRFFLRRRCRISAAGGGGCGGGAVTAREAPARAPYWRDAP